MNLKDILNDTINEELDEISIDSINGIKKEVDLFVKRFDNMTLKGKADAAILMARNIKGRINYILRYNNDTIGENASDVELYKPMKNKLKNIIKDLVNLEDIMNQITLKGKINRVKYVRHELQEIVASMDSYEETIGE